MKAHGMSGSRAYSSWNRMKDRCLNKNFRNYHRYGGRGIRACKKWMFFEGFYDDMGDPPDDYCLDRIDNDGNYEAGNCKWSTQTEQQRNKSTNSRVVDGKKLCSLCKEWKPTEGFSPRKGALSGLHCSCKPCNAEVWRERNR